MQIPFTFNEVIASGSTDMGDLSGIIPVIYPYAGGATGRSHGSDYYIANAELACVNSAKWQIVMLSLLLQNGGEMAYKIKDDFVPVFKSIKDYLDYIDALSYSGDRITYEENGTASIYFK